jgi:hypothetical protein
VIGHAAVEPEPTEPMLGGVQMNLLAAARSERMPQQEPMSRIRIIGSGSTEVRLPVFAGR